MRGIAPCHELRQKLPGRVIPCGYSPRFSTMVIWMCFCRTRGNLISCGLNKPCRKQRFLKTHRNLHSCHVHQRPRKSMFPFINTKTTGSWYQSNHFACVQISTWDWSPIVWSFASSSQARSFPENPECILSHSKAFKKSLCCYITRLKYSNSRHWT
jgi:hypothetical protein